MSRTKSMGKQRQHPKRRHSPKPLSAPRANVGVFFNGAQTAPTFPSDIILALPKGARAAPVTPPPLAAVRDAGAERLLVRKSAAAPDRKPVKSAGTRVRKPAKAARTNPTQNRNGSQPRKGRNAAAGLQQPASSANGVALPQPQAIPPEARRLPGPAAAHNPPSSAPTAIAPLPRSAAVTTYRKNGPVEVLAYWLRSSGRSIAALFKRPKTKALPKAAIIEINRLRLENLLLQRRIEILLSAQMPGTQ